MALEHLEGGLEPVLLVGHARGALLLQLQGLVELLSVLLVEVLQVLEVQSFFNNRGRFFKDRTSSLKG